MIQARVFRGPVFFGLDFDSEKQISKRIAMKRKSIFRWSWVVLIAIFIFPTALKAQDELRHEANRAFTTGEFLKYRIYYHSLVTGKLSAGYASFKIDEQTDSIYGRETMHVVANGNTSTAFGWFYEVDDRYETYIDTRTLAPWKFIRRVKEGGYTIDHDTYFDQRRSKAFFRNNKNDKRLTLNTKQYVQDVLSIIYYARTLDYSNAREGDIFKVDYMVDDTTYTAKIMYDGRENITTDLGKFKCIKIVPLLDMDGVFNKEDPMVLYVTDDKNRVPLFGKSELKIGSLKVELLEYDGLRNYFSSVIRWND